MTICGPSGTGTGKVGRRTVRKRSVSIERGQIRQFDLVLARRDSLYLVGLSTPTRRDPESRFEVSFDASNHLAAMIGRHVIERSTEKALRRPP